MPSVPVTRPRFRRRLGWVPVEKLHVQEKETKRIGVIIKAGPQVSEVKWDDARDPKVEFCINEWLQPI